jgi:FG-GAP-like repeat/Pectate lyase
VKNYGLIIRGNEGAHDVIVRGIRIRNAAIDGVQVANGAYNVVIDHVSVTGSADGNIDITEGSHDVTVSWSIFGANEKNMLVKYNASRVSLHHNVFVASAQRSPQVRIDDSTTSVATATTADIRNNLVANWGSDGYGAVVWYGPRANVVNNVFSSPGARRPLTVTDARAYVSGNLTVGLVAVNGQGTESAPFPAPAVDTHDACAAAGLVLARAGVRPVDAIDQRLLSAIVSPPCAALPPVWPVWTVHKDFNGDGQADILWRRSSGAIHIWFMDGGHISGKGTPATVASDWTIQGTGDFNGDGQADILWRHASGPVSIWLMNGSSIASPPHHHGVSAHRLDHPRDR